MTFTKSRFTMTLTILAPGAAVRLPAAEPAGYELFDHTPVDSFHVVDTTYDVIQETMRGGYRPIALELTDTWGAENSADWRFSAAFIENTGKFQRDSLFLWNYTTSAMTDLEDFAIDEDWWYWVPIDIRHRWVTVESGVNERRYAMVFVQNTESWEWRWVLNGTENDCLDLQNRGWRAVSMTIYNDSYNPNRPNLRYDAAFVRNSGDNLVLSTVMRCDADDIEDMAKSGWQVIRAQRIDGWDNNHDYNVIFVHTGNWFGIMNNQTEAQLNVMHNTYGRMIDLRGPATPSPATFLYEY